MARGRKPAETKAKETVTAVAEEVKTETVKADEAPKAAPAAEVKAAPAKKTPGRKPAVKKTEAKTAEKKPSEKKPAGRKPKELTLDDICAKLAKMIDKTKAAALTDTIAVDVEVWGWADGSNKHLYIEVKEGKATVAPYDYEGCNFKAYISYADAAAVVNGKLGIMEALLGGKLNAIGVVGDAVKLASVF